MALGQEPIQPVLFLHDHHSIGSGRSTSTGGCIETLLQLNLQREELGEGLQAIFMGCDVSWLTANR
jgi:hypothetical protein